MRACTHPHPSIGEGVMPYGDWLKASGRRNPMEDKRRSSSPPKHSPMNLALPQMAPPNPKIPQLTLSVETQKGMPWEGNSDDAMAHHVQERITKPNFKHIFFLKKAMGPKFDTTIPPHLEQVIPENINTPLYGHATCLDTNTL